LIKISNSRILRELFHRIAYHSSKTIIEKKRDKMIIHSIDTDEKSFASALLKEPFFKKWNPSNEEIVVFESKSLYNLSKIISASSEIDLDIMRDKISIIIKNDYTKRITINGRKYQSSFLELESNEVLSLTIESNIFQRIVKDLNVITDEVSIILEDELNKIVFTGRELQMDFVFELDEKTESKRSSDISSVKIPIKYVNYFLPIFKEFDKIKISVSDRNPLSIRGANNSWEFTLYVTNITYANSSNFVTKFRN